MGLFDIFKREKTKKNAIDSTTANASATEASKYAGAIKEYDVAYRGVRNTYHQYTGNVETQISSRSLKSVSKYKLNPNDTERNLKQQAGFSAEILSTAQENAAKSIEGKKSNRTIRTDDMKKQYDGRGNLIGGTNDQLYDVAEVDYTGNYIDGTGRQLKFIGNDPQECATKLLKAEYAKYYDAGVPVEIPSDFYDQVMSEFNSQACELRQLIKTAKQQGNDGLVEQYSQKLSRVEQRINGTRRSNISSQEAIDARKYPLLSTVKSQAKLAHQAGMDSVQGSLIMGGTISTLHNLVSVIQGDKNAEEAAISIAKDTSKIIPTAYAIGSAGSVVKSAMINVPSEAVQKIASTNLPESIIALAITSTQTIGSYLNGNITGKQCTLELGEKSLVFATSSTSIGIGTKMITSLNGGTIGVVGGTIGAAAGALVGAAIIGSFCSQISDYVLNHHLRQEERKRLIAEYNYAAKQERAFRSELETYIEAYFKEYRTCFDQAWKQIEESFKEGDADGVIAGANQITKKLGGKVHYETVDEFKSFLDDDSQDFIL